MHGHHSTEKSISELAADGPDPCRISAYCTTLWTNLLSPTDTESDRPDGFRVTIIPESACQCVSVSIKQSSA